jgi:hypothetical protein
MLPSFYRPIDELVGEDEPSNTVPSIDHNTDKLPYGLRCFERSSYQNKRPPSTVLRSCGECDNSFM